jgi:hypothetical protein
MGYTGLGFRFAFDYDETNRRLILALLPVSANLSMENTYDFHHTLSVV